MKKDTNSFRYHVHVTLLTFSEDKTYSFYIMKLYAVIWTEHAALNLINFSV